MKIPLFSKGYMKEAKELYPDRVTNPVWLSTPWSLEEINTCIKLGFERSIKNLNRLDYEEQFEILNPPKERISMINFFQSIVKDRHFKILSVGCGSGATEIILARYGYKNITAIDIHPNMRWLGEMYKHEVFFNSCNALSLPFEDNSFDVVFSYGVIYAISDANLKTFFSEINRVAAKNGVIIIGCGSNIPVIQKVIYFTLRFAIRLLLKKDINFPRGSKQSGWSRDRKEVEKYMPLSSYNSVVYNEKLNSHTGINRVGKRKDGSLNIIGCFIVWFSLNVYPISSNCHFWILKKRK